MCGLPRSSLTRLARLALAFSAAECGPRFPRGWLASARVSFAGVKRVDAEQAHASADALARYALAAGVGQHGRPMAELATDDGIWRAASPGALPGAFFLL
jgi:hypothetical protein